MMLMTKMMMYHDSVRDANDALTHFIRGQSILVQCHCQTPPLCPSTISPYTSTHDATRSSSLLCNSSKPTIMVEPTTRKVEVVESSDQSDDRPLAVTLICRLWEGGRVTLSTT